MVGRGEKKDCLFQSFPPGVFSNTENLATIYLAMNRVNVSHINLHFKCVSDSKEKQERNRQTSNFIFNSLTFAK